MGSARRRGNVTSRAATVGTHVRGRGRVDSGKCGSIFVVEGLFEKRADAFGQGASWRKNRNGQSLSSDQRMAFDPQHLDDEELVGKMIDRICYDNAAQYLDS